MTEHEGPNCDRLKHHFAQRVIHQARHVLEIWQRLQRSEWNSTCMAELAEASLNLQRHAERFEQVEHARLAVAIRWRPPTQPEGTNGPRRALQPPPKPCSC